MGEVRNIFTSVTLDTPLIEWEPFKTALFTLAEAHREYAEDSAGLTAAILSVREGSGEEVYSREPWDTADEALSYMPVGLHFTASKIEVEGARQLMEAICTLYTGKLIRHIAECTPSLPDAERHTFYKKLYDDLWKTKQEDKELLRRRAESGETR